MKRLTFLLTSLFLVMACGNNRTAQNDKTEGSLQQPTDTTVYILGDSYSTFKGHIPEENLFWYPAAEKDNNIQKVEQTWWYQLCSDMHFKLLKNNSYSGATICNTGYEGNDYSDRSYIKRMKDDFGPGKDIHPDILFIFGGTNDFWAGSPLGQLTYADWTDEDLKQVFPATCYLFSYLKTWNPEALIINITSSYLNEELRKGFAEAAKETGILNLELETFEVMSGHPDINGMQSIKTQLEKFIRETRQ